ncbi:Malate synthase, glyoxysomal [Gossypium arboreum]|uniref:Malate synthase, glyoxysomal n=1 Tax=Gossypium arboreum TaxID=29729 RepID=A0A0B0NMU0_GOSAR|nr:Malate synthase, glyoxysomal [Gossypium arboreum]
MSSSFNISFTQTSHVSLINSQFIRMIIPYTHSREPHILGGLPAQAKSPIL